MSTALFASIHSQHRRKVWMNALLALMQLLVVTNLSAQHSGFRLPFNHYTTRDGLAQLQIRSLTGDAYGQIWIGTQNGLSMFDGRSFRSFGPTQGVPRSLITQLGVDTHQRIWGMTHSELFVFDGVQARVFPFPGQPQRGEFVFLKDGRLLIRHDGLRIFEDSLFHELPGRLPPALQNTQDILHFNPATEDLISDEPADGRVHLFNLQGDTHTLFRYGPSEMVSGVLPLNGRLSLTIRGATKDLYLAVDGRDTLHVLEIEDDPKASDLANVRFKIYRPHLCPPYLYVTIQRANGIWVLQDDGYRLLDHLEPISKNSVFQTPSGQVYLGLSRGLFQYHLNGWINLAVPFCDLPWSVILAPNRKEVVLGCHHQGIMSMTRSGELIKRHGFGTTTEGTDHQLFPGYSLHADGTMYFGGYRGIYRLATNGSVKRLPAPYTVEGLYTDQENNILWAAGMELKSYSAGGQLLTRDTIPQVLSQKVSCTNVLVDRKGHTWLSCWGGLGRRSAPTAPWEVFTRANGSLPYESVFTLLEDQLGRIWCGGSEGIAVWEPATNSFRPILPDVINEQVSHLLLAGRDTLIILGSKDFFLLEIQDDAPRLLAHMDYLHGYQVLEPSENGAFLEETGVIWVAASSGIHRLDLGKSRSMPVETHLLLVDRVDDRWVPQQEKKRPTAGSSSRNMVIRYRLIGPLSGKASITYRIGTDGIWRRGGENGSLLIEGLPHGQYPLFLRAELPGWPEDTWPTAIVDIDVRLPIAERWIFQVTAFLLLGILMTWGLWSVWQQVQSRRAMRRLEQRVNASRLKAIQAQLNPHFIFNAMSSLQNTIQNRTPEDASRQLVRLSRLIRQVLEFSVGQTSAEAAPPMTSLEEELFLLNQYVELEQEQRGHRFHYHLDVEQELLDENPMVPPLLIQPFVENAIIHGLSPQDRIGHIWVKISTNGDELVYVIEDDGIGRSAAQKAAKNETFRHRSLGGTLLKERMDTLRALGYPCEMIIRDRQPTGTIVHLKITLTHEDRDY